MKDIDLIIIGSWPAGISTALHLLQQDPGWAGRMIVLEKAIHPRHKLCGGRMTRPGGFLFSGLSPASIALASGAIPDSALGHCLVKLSPEWQPGIYAYNVDFGIFGQPHLRETRAADAAVSGQRACQTKHKSDQRLEQESLRIDYGTMPNFAHQ
jgi:flavin-dependent dehydrogenase